jgi:hypothetical protein
MSRCAGKQDRGSSATRLVSKRDPSRSDPGAHPRQRRSRGTNPVSQRSAAPVLRGPPRSSEPVRSDVAGSPGAATCRRTTGRRRRPDRRSGRCDTRRLRLPQTRRDRSRSQARSGTPPRLGSRAPSAPVRHRRRAGDALCPRGHRAGSLEVSCTPGPGLEGQLTPRRVAALGAYQGHTGHGLRPARRCSATASWVASVRALARGEGSGGGKPSKR